MHVLCRLRDDFPDGFVPPGKIKLHSWYYDIEFDNTEGRVYTEREMKQIDRDAPGRVHWVTRIWITVDAKKAASMTIVKRAIGNECDYAKKIRKRDMTKELQELRPNRNVKEIPNWQMVSTAEQLEDIWAIEDLL